MTALLILSFGGPEKREDVIPFLENVLRGRNVPRQRLLAVAEHYYHFGGKSPLNDQNRALVAAVQRELTLPVYWGNRNWHPMLTDTLRRMRTDGVRRALVFVTSAFGSYSGCRQYVEDLARAREEAGPGAPDVEKLPLYYNHPGFLEAMTDRVRAALAEAPGAEVVYTAHSIPVAMARTAPYEAQLREACELVSHRAGVSSWRLVFQSRSGPQAQPWLEPDIGDCLRELAARARDVVVVPIGFTSDHMEVLYDLDTEARALCDSLGIHMVRAGTAGHHPAFVSMIRDLVMERLESPVASRECASGCCQRG